MSESLDIQRVIRAATEMDWLQVVLNGGPPCFHLCEDGRFCGRAERWPGHEEDGEVGHRFVSLSDLLKSVVWTAEGVLYTLNHNSITCLRCGRTSYNANDRQFRYCGKCNVFLDDIPAERRQAWLDKGEAKP